MCFYDAEPCEVWIPKAVKARKRHACMECNELIRPGETYLRVTGIFDRAPFRHVECRRCCYDRTRVIAEELAMGCSRQDADPGTGCLLDATEDIGLTPTEQNNVPGAFEI